LVAHKRVATVINAKVRRMTAKLSHHLDGDDIFVLLLFEEIDVSMIDIRKKKGYLFLIN
jgi:hypothetical protein